MTTPQPADPDSSSIRISWTQSAASDFESYRVYRSVNEQWNQEIDLRGIISTRTETEYIDGDGDFKNETYYYWVVVYDNDGNSARPDDPVVWNPGP